MPEVVLRIGGDNASGIAAVREFVASLRDVKIESEQVSKAALGTSETIAETARRNVTKALEQRDALRGLVTEYGAIGKAAAAGSEEARAAHRLEMESNARLAATYDEVGLAAKRAGTEAAVASRRAREESGVARGFASRTLGVTAFAGGAFIAGAAAGVIIKKSADEAQRAQESQAQLRNALARTGQSYEAQRESIERYLETAEKASAFDRIDLRTSLGLLVRATGDTTKAQDLLSKSVDVARGRHISLDAATRLVTRAYQGNVGALRRVGIDVQAVTTAQDKLREAHVKVTPEMARQAKAIDKQATSLEALRVLNDRYSGAAAAHARTLTGREEALGNAFTDVSVSIGNAVTPALTRMFEWMTKTIQQAQHSKTVHEILHDTFKAIGFVLRNVVVPMLRFTIAEWKLWIGVVRAVVDVTRNSIIPAFKEFFDLIKRTGRAAWEAMIQTGKAAVYTILQIATAAIRGILEVASHLPFVGDKAREALDSINHYIAHWKPDFGNVVDAFGKGGQDSGQAFVDAMNRSIKGGFTASISAGTFTPGHRAGPRGEMVVGSVSTSGLHGVQAGLVATGATALGVPYRYGGAPSLSSPTDCSGLMVAIFARHNISLPRTSEAQYAQAPIKPGRHILPGDLVFSEGIHPGHVGLYIGSGNVLEDPHTGDHVKVVPLSGFGWNGESARWWAQKAKKTPKGGDTPSLPSIADVIAQGQPDTTSTSKSTAHHVAAAVTLTALGVPASLQNAISKAADEARNAIAKGHYGAAIDFYKRERADLEKEAADLRRKLRDPKLTARQREAIHKDLTVIGNEIRDVGGEITKAHNSIAKAARDQLNKEKATLQASVSTFQSQVSSAWSSVSQGIVSAFEAQTQSLVDALGKQFFQGIQTPEEARLVAAQAADQAQSLQDALDQAQAQLAADLAGGGETTTTTSPFDPLQTVYGQPGAQQLPITTTAAGTSIDQAKIDADRKAIAEAQHQIDLAKLESDAQESRIKADQAYADAVAEIQRQRQREEEHLVVALDKFGNAVGDGSKSMADLQPLLDQYGLQLSAISDGSFTFQTGLDDLTSSVGALDKALRDLAILVSQITGKPVNLPAASAPTSARGTHSTPDTGVGIGGHFKGGGIIPGPMIGPEDTVQVAVSTGEAVLSRDELRLLVLAATHRPSAPVAPTGPIYVLGTTKDEVGRALARIITPAQNRAVGFKAY